MSLFTAHRRTVAVAAILAALFVAGCSKKSTSVLEPNSPDIASIKNGGDMSMANAAVRAVALVQERHTADLMGIAGVVGTATSVDADGNLAVMVMTEHELGAGRLPASVEGIPVFEEVTGKIRAMAVADHQVKQTPPVFLYQAEKANPVPSGICPPTIPCPPMLPTSAWKKCIEPPLPLEQPVARPNISAIAGRGSMPSASECP